MAMRVSNGRALASAVRSSRTALTRRNNTAIRGFSSTQNVQVVVSSDQPNMRHATRQPDAPGGLHVPIVNPADKYAAKADDMHRYGSWLMGCLPKYIQQFSVWKDELVIYISPSGVIPVFTFLKCKSQFLTCQIFDDELISSRQYCSGVYTSLRHYSRRFSHSRPAI
jgi:NADH dehydrogenase (ubiquinone) Fe-S protein 3